MSIFCWIGWIASVLFLFLFVTYWRYCLTRRTNLDVYIMFLLLNDEVRSNHKRKFENYVKELEEEDASSMISRACEAVENVADEWAEAKVGKSSWPAAMAMLSLLRRGEEKNLDRY